MYIINDSKIETFTIDDAVEKMGFGMFQIKLSLLTGLGKILALLVSTEIQ